MGRKMFSLITVSLVLFTILPGTSATLAQRPANAVSLASVDLPGESSSQMIEQMGLITSQPNQEYLLRFPVPSLEQVLENSIPLNYPVYFQQTIRPAMETLEMLRAEGKVAQFEPDMEAFGIRVWLTETGQFDDLQTVPGVESISEIDVAFTCPADPATAVQDVLRAAQAYQGQPQVPLRMRAFKTGVPTIHVYISSSVSYGTRYSHVDGEAAPDTPVHIRVETSEGGVVIEQTVTSYDWNEDGVGHYYLSPSYQTCQGFGWTLHAGQTVIVEAEGKTSVFQIPVVQSVASPDSDTVSGQTAPYRDLMVSVSATSKICTPETYTSTVQSNADGSYQFNLSEHGGFDHSGYLSLYVYDSNRSYVYSPLIIPQIHISWQYRISGYVTQPGSYVLLNIKRDGSVVQTLTTDADEAGYFKVDYYDLQSGDLIQVEASGLVMEYEMASLNDIVVDWANGRVTGTTTPGRWIRGHTYLFNSPINCGDTDSVDTDTANISGGFGLSLSSDALLREGASLYLYDTAGHYQYDYYYAPYIEYDSYLRGTWSYGYIIGYWYDGISQVTVRIYNGSTLENEYVDDNLSSRYYYSVYIDSLILPGRRIEVSDGIHTPRSLVVPDMQARLNADNNTISGTAPTNGTLDVTLDQWCHPVNENRWYSRRVCNVARNGGGSYTADLSGAYWGDADRRDRAGAIYYETDGDRVEVLGYDLWLNMNYYPEMNSFLRNNDKINGHSPQGGGGCSFSVNGNRIDPTQPVTVDVYASDGTWRASVTDSDIPDSLYYTCFDIVPQAGYRVDVTNGTHSTSSTIPTLTVNESPQENRLYGQGPALQTIYPFLDLQGRYIYWYTSAQVGSDGNYSASFEDVYPSSYWSYGCGETTVGGCYHAKVAACDGTGHRFTVNRSYPPNVVPDEYDEGMDDDDPERASIYQVIQSHTFHDWYDVDWVAVNIPASNVGRLYSFQTLNLGDIAQTNLALYDSDHTTLLTSYDGSDDAAVIHWRPTHSGWHYIKITSRGSTVYCGATYDFRIQLEAEWTALIYMNGDSNLGAYPSFARGRLEQVVGQLQDVNVVMLWDGMNTHTGDTWRYHVQPGGQYQDGENRWYMGELNLGDGNVLADFLKWGMENYPASHYYAVIADHGKGTVGLSWDFNAYAGENVHGTTKNFSNSDRITPMELREAIKQATQNGDRRIDVLYYDTCLMGMWEHAYQVKDYADYLVFSQNEGWAVFAFDKYVQALSGNDVQSVAAEIARLYSVEVELIARPYTISTIDLAQIDPLRQQVDQLASLLESGMSTYKQQVRASRQATQRVDSTGDFELTEEDTMLDLYDFATQVKSQIADASVQSAATAVQTAVNQAVVAEYHQSGETPSGGHIDLDDTHGLSIYFPMQSGRLFSVYAGGQMFKSTADSGWDETLTEYYGAMGLPPTMDDPDDTNPIIGQVDVPTIYLPLVVRLYVAP